MLESKTILQPLLLRHRAQRAMRPVSARLRPIPSTVAETGETTINAYQDKAKCDVDQSLVPSLMSFSHRSTPDQDYFHFFPVSLWQVLSTWLVFLFPLHQLRSLSLPLPLLWGYKHHYTSWQISNYEPIVRTLCQSVR